MSDLSKYTRDLSPEQRALFELLLRERQNRKDTAQPEAIPRRQDKQVFPLSAAQQRLWFLDQWAPGSPNYNLPQAVHLQGRLNIAVLERCLNTIIGRHEAIRSRFIAVNGKPEQHIIPRLTIKVPIVDLRELPPHEREHQVKQITAEEAQRPFNLATGPLIRATLLRLATMEHVLLLTMHHIVSDGWSNGVFVREMSVLYEALSDGKPSPLPELPIQYADFAAWQQAALADSLDHTGDDGASEDLLSRQLDYWRQQLDGAPTVLELPTDRPRPAVQTFRGATRVLMLPASLREALNLLSQREGTTLFMTLLAAFKTLLYRYVGQDDIVVGTPIANRNRAEIEPLIGPFVNTLVLRTSLSGNPTFRELLQRVRSVSVDAYTNQDLPFERLVDELRPDRDVSHSTLFQVMFALQNAPMPVLKGRGLTITPLHTDSGTAKFDLSLDMMETEEGILALLEYNTDLFDNDRMDRLWEHFHTLLQNVIVDPDRRIEHISLMSPAEQQQLVERNMMQTTYAADTDIVALFEAQVARTPKATAVIFGQDSLTYLELNQRANQLAHWLRQRGVGPEVVVGLCCTRSLDLMIGLLGILKAGGTYVPLDPNYPLERLAYIFADTRISVIVTQQPLAAALPDHGAQIVCLDTDWSTIAQASVLDPAPTLSAEHTAYIIYTSGSSGKPKGVMVSHRALANFTSAAHAAYELTRDDRVLQFASITFDASAEEIYPCLTCGATLVLRTDAMLDSYAEFLHMCRQWQLTVLDLPTVYWHELTASIDEQHLALPETLRLVIIGGERAIPDRVTIWQRHAGPAIRLLNTYGPTETTVVATRHDITDLPADSSIVPIGRPIANVQTFVLDRIGQPVPIGIAGELYIGGDGLARGYLNQPALTARSFVPHPFSHLEDTRPGARLYRTGDLVRYQANGTLEFLGRIDGQVKIRGFRIELGEIEIQLRRHPLVREAVVMAREDTPGQRRLVAYLVPTGADTLNVSELNTFLRAELPEYMAPAVYIFLDSLPVTSSGKIDHRALPVPDQSRADHIGRFISPRTPIEDVLTGIWAEVLELERVGVYDNFFDLGGHSLLATQVISRINNTFQMEVPLRTLFDKPSVAELAAQIEALQEAKEGRQVPPIVPVDRTAALPLSFSQERLWFIDQLTPGNTAYNTPGAARIRGKLDLDALHESFKAIVRRHEILRTTFQGVNGHPIQVVADPQEFTLTWSVVDLQHLPEAEREPHGLRIVTQEAQQSFDLARGPLFRVMLLRLNPEEHLLVLPTHHIIYDLMSVGVFMREMRAFYEAFAAGQPDPLAPMLIQFSDFTAWQRGWLQGQLLAQQLDYWKQCLQGATTVLELPTDRPRPPVQTYNGARQHLHLSRELSKELKALCRQEGVTPFMLLLTTFKILLYRHTGQTDIIVGSPIANRNRYEIEDLIGFFVNTLVLRSNLDGQPSFRQTLHRVREVALGAYAHQDLPFEKLVEAVLPTRDPSRNPLFQVMFSYLHSYIAPLIGSDDLSVEVIRLHGERSQFDMSLDCWETTEQFMGSFDYNTDLFDQATMVRFARHLETLLASVVTNPDLPIDQLNMLTCEDQEQLAAWSKAPMSLEQVDTTGIHALFEAQVARTPDALAVLLDEQQLTYHELNARVNQLAHHLQVLGVGPETLVGICAERSVELVVGMLGVLKAGGAYVPLDPSYPPERLQFMLTDAQVLVLLTQAHLQAHLPKHSAPVLCLDADWPQIAQQPATNPYCAATPEHPAYLIYTSGSTGQPKGVIIPHRALVNHMQWMHMDLPLQPDDRVLQKTPFSFDASVWEFYAPLLAGASLILAQPEGHRDAAYLARTIQHAQITVLQAVPVLLHTLLNEPTFAACQSLRRIFCGGEALPAEVVQRCYAQLPHVALYNLYGPTETTIDATWWPCDPARDLPSVPIGRPVANTRIYLLDRHLQLVPIGIQGELYIGGVQLARGYHCRPELTAEKFVPDPFSPTPGARLYRTGDLGRWLPTGAIQYLGRVDAQIKLRGFRIELGEIEALLHQHAAIREAAVIVRDQRTTERAPERQLVAYLVPTANPPTGSALRDYLRQHVPAYMIPAAFVVLDALPLTPSGKLDRQALPDPESPRSALDQALVPPRTPTEELIAGFWSTVLGIHPIGVHDNFFALGGYSLLGTQVMSRLRDTFHVEVPLKLLFETPTVAGLAAHVESAQRAMKQIPLPPLEPAPRDDHLPLSFAQQRLWFLDQLQPDNPFYNMHTALRLSGPLDVAALENSLNAVVMRHESLRTTFIMLGEHPRQVIAPHLPIRLPVVDLTTLPEAEREPRAIQLAQAEAQQPFDLARGPVIRAGLLHLGDTEHVLLLTMHHIVSDGWSMGILIRELGSLYTTFAGSASRAQSSASLPELPIQYADFAVWQRQWLSGEVLQQQLAYWKQQLGGELPVLNLPTDRPRPSIQSFEGATYSFLMPKMLQDALTTLSQREGVTLYMTLLAAFNVLLARYSNQDDILISSPIANRTHKDIEDLIGFFVNTVVLRTDLSGNPSFLELLQRVREVALGAYMHQDLPFEYLVEQLHPDRDLSRQPIFQVIFALQNAPMPALHVEDLTFSIVDVNSGTAKFDLTMFLWEQEDGLNGMVEYATDLFDAATITRFIDHFQTLLTHLAEEPQQLIAYVPLVTEAERQQLLTTWNPPATPYPRERCVHTLVAEHAARTPDAVAIVFPDEQCTYAELNRRANQLAHHLQALGIGVGDPVGICLERSLSFVVGVLGILKAGGAYVPLDPTYPAERLQFMLEDTQMPVLITVTHLAAALPGHTARQVYLDTQAAELAAQPGSDPVSAVTAEHLAYLIYTSGSTGQPKGTGIPHRAITRLVCGTNYLQVTAEDGIALASNTSFDAATFELWGALINGARLVGVPRDILLSPQALAEHIRAYRIDTMFLTTALFNQIAREIPQAFAPMRAVLFGGEAVDPRSVALVLDAGGPQRLLHVYGPTESTTFASWFEVTEVPPDAATIPIGYPLAQTQLYVLDDQILPVPVGVPGELYIGGDGLAVFYLNRPALTAEKFVPDPFSHRPGARLYRTGDVVRYRPDGAIEFLGRRDHQMKLRGFRIELGEIEAVLRQHPAIRDAIVLAHADAPGDMRLVAYIVRTDTPAVSAATQATHIDDWQTLYDETYVSVEAADPTFHIVGWHSSYTGQPLPAAEMHEWRDATVDRIRALQPSRVLEIGVGTGLLLFPLAGECNTYHGIDFSAPALAHIHQHLPPDWTHVTLNQQRADELADLAPGSFDTIIINSVVQYFPSAEYLVQVISQAVALLAPGGHIFVGDVRSRPLLDAFATAVVLAQAAPETSRETLSSQVQQQVYQERELLLDPEFFHTFRQRLPRISNVQVEIKRGQAHNEMSQFRYDVTLTVDVTNPTPTYTAYDWSAQSWTSEDLRAMLQDHQSGTVLVRRIPSARLQAPVQALAWLHDVAGPATAAELRAAAERQTQERVDPEALWTLGSELGFQVRVGWNDSGKNGCYDAVFSRTATPQLPMPSMSLLQSYQAYATIPMVAEEDLSPALREYLQARLPEYMIPAAFLTLDALPLTPNGKVDRKALPTPSWNSLAVVDPKALPRTPIETMLVEIWQQVMGLPAIGIHSNFFELGGHSLLATQVISRIRALFDLDLPVRALFEHPTIAALSTAVAEAQRSLHNTPELPPLTRCAPSGPVPLSFAQQRLWFIEHLQVGTTGYHVASAFEIQGSLNMQALQTSLDTAIARHESLRTTFVLIDEQPMQIIAPPQSQPIVYVDMVTLDVSMREAEVQRYIRETFDSPFDLVNGPLLRAVLLRVKPDEHILLLVLHHVITDGWSMEVLISEMAGSYIAAIQGQPVDLPPLSIQYADYAVWQRQWLQGEILDQQRAYWRRQLAAVPPLQIPSDHPRPRIQSYRGASVSLVFDAVLIGQLHKLSRQTGTTLFIVLLAAWQTLLARYSGQDDIAVGTPIAGRTQPETEGLIGFFVNTLVLRGDLSGNPTFRELLARLRTTTLDAYAHQDMPFEAIVDAVQPERDLSRHPLFQVMFAFMKERLPEIVLPEIRITPVNVDITTANFDLTLYLFDTPKGVVGELAYALDLFEHTTIEQMAEHFQMLLAAIVANPDERLAYLPLLAESERQQLLVDWNRSAAVYPRDAAVHQLIEAQATRTPNTAAIVYEGASLSYAELNTRANQLAHYLRAQGVGPDVLVALMVERSLEMIVGMLAILKAGAAYVPLDPAYPIDRLQYMLSHSHAAVILTQDRLVARLPEHTAQVFRLDADWDTLAEQPTTNPPRTVLPDNLAYIIFTSGSTGRPKGVMVTQQGLINLVYGLRAYFDDPAVQITGLITSISFDISVNQIFPTLIFGRTLHIISDPVKFNSRALLNYLDKHQIHLLDAVPSYMQAVLSQVTPEQPPNALRYLLIGGEKIEQHLLEAVFGQLGPQVEVVNIYGLTEISDINALGVIRACDLGKPITVGKPLQNNRIYVLDAFDQPQPVGIAGEICVAGESVSRGYLFRPELTAERFVACPFEDGRLMVRTGDLGRWQADGTIEILGRIDHQVKVRGFRIELGEIEQRLLQHQAVQAAVVVVRDETPVEAQLVAYVVPYMSTQPPTSTALREHLAAHLPEYMIPGAFVTLDALPKTPNGKIDRKALPAPELSIAADESFVAPRTPIEAMLASIWAELLGVERIGIHHNFFALGGHSLLTIRLLEQIRKRLNQVLPVAALFEDATIAALAQRLEQSQSASSTPLIPIQPAGTNPPLFCVHGLGGSVLPYADLGVALGLDQPLYGLQALGFYGGEEPQTDIKEMATVYLKAVRSLQPHGPYYLAGWSLGGVIALEMAHMLDAQGEEVALLALLDSIPRQPTPTLDQNDVTMLFDVAEMYGLHPDRPAGAFSDFETAVTYMFEQAHAQDPRTWEQIDASAFRRLARLGIGQLKAIYGYTLATYTGTITLFYARDNFQDQAEQRARTLRHLWAMETGAHVELVITPGTHWTILDKPNVHHLANHLRQRLPTNS